MMKKKVTFFFLLFVFLLTITVAAEDETVSDSAVVIDTTLFEAQQLLLSTASVSDPTNYETKIIQSPSRALFKSMFIPGWGQLGNGKRTKALFFAGLDSWMIISALHYGSQASDFKDKFEAAGDLELRREYYKLYLDRKDERNKFTWFAVIVSFISMFDAYVDAHLSGYPAAEKENNVTLEIVPEEEGQLLKLSYRF